MAPHPGAFGFVAVGDSAAAGVFLLVMIVGVPAVMVCLGALVVACLRRVTGWNANVGTAPVQDVIIPWPNASTVAEDEMLTLLLAGELDREEYRRRMAWLAEESGSGPWWTTTGGKA